MDKNKIIEKVRQIVIKCNPEQEWLVDRLAFLHIAGSQMYGTNTKDSDLDVVGIVIAPDDFWIGAKSFDNFTYQDEEIDITIHDIRKVVRMVAQGAPNIMESLFVPKQAILLDTPQWEDIGGSCRGLINQSLYSGFKGYATAQIRKLEGKLKNKTGRRYIIEKFGYDCKFASHAFRLLQEGIELLETGGLQMPRPNAKELLEIKQGKKYSSLLLVLEDLVSYQQDIDEALVDCILPKKMEFNKVNDLCKDIFYSYVEEREWRLGV